MKLRHPCDWSIIGPLAMVLLAGCVQSTSSAPDVAVDEAQKRAMFENKPIQEAARDYFLPTHYADYFPGMDTLSARGADLSAHPDQLLDLRLLPEETPHSIEKLEAAVPYDPKPLPLDKKVVLGRNTWMIWCAGNEGFWDWLATNNQGFIDLLKVVDSRQRAERFQQAGLINEPGMVAARSAPRGEMKEGSDEPDEGVFGLWLDMPADPRIREWRRAYLRQTFAQINDGVHKSQRGQDNYRGGPFTAGSEPGYDSPGTYMRREREQARRAAPEDRREGSNYRTNTSDKGARPAQGPKYYSSTWVPDNSRPRGGASRAGGGGSAGYESPEKPREGAPERRDDAASAKTAEADYPVDQAYEGDEYDREYGDIPAPDIYGISSGVVGLRLFPNPRFDAAARQKWDPERYYNDESYYLDPNLVRPFRVGMSCAFCHASYHPLNPPRDLTNPEWVNISGNIGAQYLRIRSVFGNLLKDDNFVYHLLDSQPPGTIDTSLIASDNINNPNTMNAVFNVPQRVILSLRNPRERQSQVSLTLPSLWTSPGITAPQEGPDPVPMDWHAIFQQQGLGEQLAESNDDPRYTPRVLLDGSDSIGAYGALARVYLNIGSYYERWNQLHQPVLGFTPQAPFRISDCENNSVYWNATRLRVGPMRDYFLAGTHGMPLLATKDAHLRIQPVEEDSVRTAALARGEDPNQAWERARARHVDYRKLAHGRRVFAENCIVCHSSIQPESSLATFFAEPAAPDGKATDPAALQQEREAYVKAYGPLMERREKHRAQGARDGEFWEHDPGKWLVDPEYVAWAKDAVNRREFWKWNYLSSDYRVPINLVGTNSARALATNALTGHMWEDFTSESYRQMPTVGEIRYWNPYKGGKGDWDTFSPRHRPPQGVDAGGGGVGFYRVPTLVSIWATAPLLHNNSLGVFNNDPTIDGRLDAFDDAIRKLLWKERRLLSSSYNGADAARLASDQGLIWRTPRETYLTIRGKFVPHALEQFRFYRWVRERLPWLERVMPLWLPSAMLLFAAYLLLAAAGEPKRQWWGALVLIVGLLFASAVLVWPWLPVVGLAILSVLLLLVAQYDPRLFRVALGAILLTFITAVGTWAVLRHPDWPPVVLLRRIEPAELPIFTLILCGLALVFPLSVKWSRWIGYSLIPTSLVLGSLIYFSAGRLGDVRVGPIPAGTPVNLLANVNPEAPLDKLKSSTLTAITQMSQFESQHLSEDEQRKILKEKVAPALLEINKCPDFVMDRGHYYEWFESMTDEDKDALIELLKTF